MRKIELDKVTKTKTKNSMIRTMWLDRKWANGIKSHRRTNERNSINKLTLGRKAIASLQWKWAINSSRFISIFFSKWNVSMSPYLVGGSNSIFRIIKYFCIYLMDFPFRKCRYQPSASKSHYCINVKIPAFIQSHK